MKTTLQKTIIVLAAGLISLTAQAQKNKKVYNNYFELSAAALVNDKATSDYEIAVYLDGQLMESKTMTKKHAISLVLESHKVYSIVFRKANYPDRLVIVNTDVPKHMKEVDEYPFDMQVELSPDASSYKKELEDFPVAVLLLDEKEKNLIASESYYLETHDH